MPEILKLTTCLEQQLLTFLYPEIVYNVNLWKPDGCFHLPEWEKVPMKNQPHYRMSIVLFQLSRFPY
jgi:hypothetical protein